MSRGTTGAVVGGAAWMILVAAGVAGVVELGVLEALLAFAPLVIVPLALELRGRLVDGTKVPTAIARFERAARSLVVPAALFTAVSMALPVGGLAAIVAAPWIALCGLIAVAASARAAWSLRRTVRSERAGWAAALRTRPVDTAIEALLFASALYLLVGALWLVLSRLGVPVAGFLLPIPLLTAIHFHYTTFALSTLAAATGYGLARRGDVGAAPYGETGGPPQRGAHAVSPSGAERRNARHAGSRLRIGLFEGIAVVLVFGPALLATGWIAGLPGLKLFATLLISAATVGLAALVLAVSSRISPLAARWFLRLSGASVAAAMVLAAVYETGEFLERGFISIPRMAQLHGVMNAMGFALCGLVGWLLATARPMAERRSSQATERPPADMGQDHFNPHVVAARQREEA